MEATCNCGAVHVKVDDPELFTKRRGHICHCYNCRKTSGSGLGATNLMIETDKVTITGADNMTLYEDPNSLSGNIVRRYFCKICGNPIKSETKPADEKGMVILKTGIFEAVPTPEMETFAKDRHGWVPKHDGTHQFKTKAGGEKHEE